MAAVAERVPPQDIEAEESVLGAMLVAEPTLTRVIDEVGLTASDFYLPRHEVIFAAILDLYRASKPVTEKSVVDLLADQRVGRGSERMQALEAAGGKDYIYGLSSKVPAAGNAKHYARIVQKHARRLAVIDRAQDAIAAAHDGTINGEVDSLISALEIAKVNGDSLSEPTIDRWSDGASFILDGPDHVEAIWGRDDEVLHPDGEPLLIVSQPGAGKTTVAQQYSLRLGGIIGGDLLGLPVKPVLGKVVYVAADRPSQAARSFRRMVGEDQRVALAECLDIWRGPLPFDFAKDPQLLYRFLADRGAGAVVIDSLGATAYDLASDEAGSRIFAAMGEVTAEGIQVVMLHHDRKRDQSSDRAKTIDDVYGSRWITAAAGSILYLDGQPGDLVMGVRHLKQPVNEIGPLTIRHDHVAGRTSLYEKADLLDLAVAGISPRDAACDLFDTVDPSRNQIEKARRRLDKLAESGRVTKTDGDRVNPAIYTTVVAGS